MTLREALLESKESGKDYMRLGDGGYGGWVRWDAEHVYTDLTAEDLVADDWVPSSEGIHKITNGRWRTIE